jgi:hypothetical protein
MSLWLGWGSVMNFFQGPLPGFERSTEGGGREKSDGGRE